MDTLAAILVILSSLLGIALTMVTLPGIWIALAVAIICELWRGDLLSWYTLGAVFVIGVIAELGELLASAAGASKMGGTKRGALGSLLGAFLGAVAGSPFFFPVGTILGGAVGAGLGALIFERHAGEMSWGASMKVGTGAAAGRLAATLMKTVFAAIVAVILSVGVLR